MLFVFTKMAIGTMSFLPDVNPVTVIVNLVLMLPII